MVISNLGLSKLIAFSYPVLVSIYPPCIVLILLSFTLKWWKNPTVVIAPTMLVSFVVGLIGAVKASDHLKVYIPEWMTAMPLYKQDLVWVLPTIVVLVVAILCDKFVSPAAQHKQA